MNKRNNSFKKIFLGIIGFFIVIYIIGIYVFSKYTYPFTYLNNQKIGFNEIETVFATDKYEDIHLLGKDEKEYIINPQELGFLMKYDKEIEIVQNSYKWPMEIIYRNDIQNPLFKTVNEKNLKKWIENSAFMRDLQDPVDAKIVKKDDSFVIEDEIIGEKLIYSEIYNEIVTAYENNETKIVLEYYDILPKVYRENLLTRAEYLNSLTDVDISIVLPNNLSEKLYIDQFVHDNKNEIDKNKIVEYVKTLKSKYDNVKKSREFVTFNGDKVEVPGGNYGIQLNLNETVELIFNEINKSNIDGIRKLELVYTSKSSNGGEIGNTYVEISIANQRMVFYKNGETIVDTPIVTGLPNGYYNTPRGVWNVWIKETGRYLQGKNLDGTEYKSWVNYWMQVDYTGVGIHDASWQSSFGGQRYKWAGSHGCINTPYTAVQTIYNNIDFGTPVIIY